MSRRLGGVLRQNSDAGIQVAPLPESLLTRCQADESLLADILTKKFVDHLPLYRINEMLLRDGIGISRQLMSQWVIRCGNALKPLYFSGLIPHLKNYTCHAYARLDNNVAERAVRPLALGRKNWLFVGSEEGGEAAAVIPGNVLKRSLSYLFLSMIINHLQLIETI